MSTIPPLSGPPLYRYIPGVGKVSAAVNGPTGATGPQGTAANTGATGPAGPAGPAAAPEGNTLTVDAVYGSDVSGALSPYTAPFSTITAALSNASSGQLVFVRPGTYNESLTVPANVSLNGAGAQAVVIQRLNVTSNVTLLTMGSNSRVENFTANLSSSSNVDLIGVDFPNGTVPTAKLRNSIWTVTSTATGSPTILGCRSAGTSSTAFTAANMIQRSSLNVVSSSAGSTRGILVSGSNRFSVRDIVINARGTGANIVGVETTDAGAFADIKTTTIFGTTHDINRTAGTIQLGFTDLVNNDANGNSFSTVTEPAHIGFGILGNIAGDKTYYLVPGTVKLADLEVDTNPTFTLSKTFQIPFNQPVVIFSILVRFTGTIGTGQAVAFHVHKNGSSTPSISVSLGPGESSKTMGTQSVVFATNDTFHTECVTTGNPGAGTFYASVATY
jgi:hypothetical protein